MLRLDHVGKAYRGPGDVPVVVLQDVSFGLAAGEVKALVGPSGSGKTTILTIAALLQRPDTGCVKLAGSDAAAMGERERTAARAAHIGYVFQAANLLPQLTALENVFMPGLAPRRRADPGHARGLLEQVGLSGRTSHLPGQLSGGEAQRVALCRALYNGPSVLLADEPTAGLDGDSSTALRALLRRVADDGVAVLVDTHDPETVAWANSSLGVSHGRLAAPDRLESGPPAARCLPTADSQPNRA